MNLSSKTTLTLRILLLSVIIIGNVSCGGGTRRNNTKYGIIKGKIYEEINGQDVPVSGVLVEIRAIPNCSYRTDKEGKFILGEKGKRAIPKNKQHRIEYRKTKYYSEKTYYDFSRGEIELYITKLPDNKPQIIINNGKRNQEENRVPDGIVKTVFSLIPCFKELEIDVTYSKDDILLNLRNCNSIPDAAKVNDSELWDYIHDTMVLLTEEFGESVVINEVEKDHSWVRRK